MSGDWWRDFWTEKQATDEDVSSQNGRRGYGPAQWHALAADAFAALDPVGGRLLDLGCGNGTLGSVVGPCFGGYVGCDFSLPALLHDGFYDGFWPSSRVCADARAIPFADDTFDRVMVAGVIHYFADGELPAFFEELRRVTKDDGKAFVSGIPDARAKGQYQDDSAAGTRATWYDPHDTLMEVEYYGWRGTCTKISPHVWQSRYMFDLRLEAV